MNPIEERVAVLEIRTERIDEIEERTNRIAMLEMRAASTEAVLHDINDKVTLLSDQFLRHKGFIGGVVFTITSLWAIVGIALSILWKR